MELTMGNNSSKALQSYIERVENLEEEKSNIATDIKEVYAEAKGNGFDVKTMRKIIARRRIEREERMEQDMLLETYEKAIESLFSTDDNDE